jgi:hypothetical protein
VTPRDNARIEDTRTIAESDGTYIQVAIVCPRCELRTERRYLLDHWTPEDAILVTRQVHMRHTCVPRWTR